MNVQTIAEVLIEQLAKMETTAKRIENAASQPINVDTKELKELLSHQDEILKQQLELSKEKLYVPKWFANLVTYAIIFFALFAATAAGLSIHYKHKFDKEHETAVFWLEQYQELEKTIPPKKK